MSNTRNLMVVVIMITLLFGYNYSQKRTSQTTPPDDAMYMIDGEYVQKSSTSKEPSSNALRISSYLVVGSSANDVRESKIRHGDENMSHAELIKILASQMDNNPSVYAHAEALMEQMIAEEARQVVDYSYNYEDSDEYLNLKSNLEREKRIMQSEIEKAEREAEEAEQELRDLERKFGIECRDAGGTFAGGRCINFN